MNIKALHHTTVTSALWLLIAMIGMSLRPSAATASPQPADTITAEHLSRADIERLYRQGNELFRKGLEQTKTEPAAAKVHFAEAAALWRTVIAQGNIHNARLELNLANASLLAGDPAHAIAAFRRAQSLDPTNVTVRNSLAAARRAAGTESLAPGVSPSPPSNDGGFIGTINRVGLFMSWAANRTSEHLPPRLLLISAAACYLGAFGLGVARVCGAPRISRWAPVGLAVLSLLIAGPLVARDVAARETRDGVVIQPGTIGRNGPAEMYDPAFKEPLAAGLEVRIIELRNGWGQIRLADGRTAWVPTSILEYL